MKIKDYRDAQLHYTKDDRGDATGAFEMFVAEEPSSMDQEPRNMYADGQLVSNTVDGSRPGYGGKDAATFTSGTGTGKKSIDDPKKYKIVKKYLNQVKSQKNKRIFLDWSEQIGNKKTKWYTDLSKEVQLSRDPLNKLINKVTLEEFPNAYAGKTGRVNYAREMVVKTFIDYWNQNGAFDGNEKLPKILNQFRVDSVNHKFENINRYFMDWKEGKFEIPGVDRKNLDKNLLKDIKNYKPNAKDTRSLTVAKQLKYLDGLSPKYSFDTVEKLFAKQFPDNAQTLQHRLNQLTQLKRNGAYNTGAGNVQKIAAIKKGDRSKWLIEGYGKGFKGNYGNLIKKADDLLAAGDKVSAERLYKAADKFFSPNGIFTKAAGEGEHPLSRNMGDGPIGNQLKINSLVSGDLNQFKKFNFDSPVRNAVLEYNNPKTTDARRAKLKIEIENRKKLMNILTEGPNQKGIVESVKFNYGPKELTASVDVKDIDKVKNFDINKYITAGEDYRKSFVSQGKKIGLIDKSGNIIKDKLDLSSKANLLSQFCNRKKLQSAGSVQGLTCSMEEIQTNMKKQINEAAKVSKDGKIPKKFGKLRGFAKMFFGDIAIPLEYMFMAPDLAAGDVEGALRSSTTGLFGAGKIDLAKLPPGEGKKYIRHTNAITNFLKNYQSKLMAEEQLKNLKPGDEEQFVASDQLAQAEKNMADIVTNYRAFGYNYAPEEKGLLEGKVAAQKLIRDKVTSDFDKKIDKGASTEFFKDSNKELLKENLRSLGGDPYKVTPINNLEDYIKNKGEATAGNTNILFNRLPYTLEQAEAYGVPQIFDTYAGGYAGVETPGSMEDGQVDMGTKNVRDAYSSLPINMASQLAALEKKEFEEGMLKRRLEQELFAGGGIAGLSGSDKSGRPPESGPASQGLRSLYKNGRKL